MLGLVFLSVYTYIHTCIHCSDARGLIVGLTAFNNKSHIVRAGDVVVLVACCYLLVHKTYCSGVSGGNVSW